MIAKSVVAKGASFDMNFFLFLEMPYSTFQYFSFKLTRSRSKEQA
jgi:hypothetical protein